MALDPERLAVTMPTGAVVTMGLRRPDHDQAAVVAAYDAPFPTSESKAGARRFPFCLPFAEPEAGGAAWQQRCYEQLPKLGLPVHFVWGDEDVVFPFDGAEAWAAAVPGATLDRIPHASHFVQEDAPAECVAAVLARL